MSASTADSRLESLAPRAELVHRLARELGFALVGVAPAAPSEHAEHVRAWIAAGKHGEMDYLSRRLDERLDPRVFLPGARSVIGVADLYAQGQGATDGAATPRVAGDPLEAKTGDSLRRGSGPLGRIARYAWGDDYHVVMKKRLAQLAAALEGRWPAHRFLPCVDTAAVLEREHAARAGLGWIGKHTLLIHPRLGSWFFIGEIVTTLPIQTAAEAGAAPIADHCGTCTRCIDACPTRCITPHSVDASRCVSYLTLEHRGPIEAGLHAAMGDWLAGCDVCQEVCPFNEGAKGEGPRAKGEEKADRDPVVHTAYAPRPRPPALPLLEVLGWDEPARQRAMVRSALKRVKLAQLKRNALIAAGNHLRRYDAPELRARLEAIAHDAAEPDLVRLTARQVLDAVAGAERSTFGTLCPRERAG